MGFYQDTTATYGANVTQWLKKWSNLNSKKASFLNRRIYLLECKRNDVIPRHISQNIKNLYSLLDGAPASLIRKMHDFNVGIAGKVLKFEISHTNHSMRVLEREMTELYHSIIRVLPKPIYDEYFLRQNTLFKRSFYSIKEKNINKIQKLIQNSKINLKTEDKWFRNISSKQVPDNVKLVLSLGPKFSLPTTVRDVDIEKLLAHVEQIVGKIQVNRRNLVRAKVTSIITNHIHKFRDIRNSETRLINKVKSFLRSNEDLLVLESDKGSVTVVMDKIKYNEGIRDILNKDNSFKKLNRDPTLTVQTKANTIVSNLVKQNTITEEQGKKMKIYNALSPRIYGNPKIHKENVPLRPIVSSILGPTIHLAKYIADILKKAYNTNNKYYITDSFHFARIANNLIIPDNYVLISLDAVNLFGNLSKNIINTVINNKWDTIKIHTNGLTEKKFMEIINFILENNYFSYNNEFYLQTMGCAMGSKLSPIISQYVMDYVLDQCINKLPFDIAFVKKFVDDLILAVPSDKVEVMLETINNIDVDIQFTVEREENRTVPFLDTLVTRDMSNTIKLDWYRKPSAAGKYVHYKSNHNINIKVNFIKQMRNRINDIYHTDFREKNLKTLENLLLDNGYPRGMIRKLIYNKGETKKRNKPPEQTEQSENFGVMPYYNVLTDKLINVFNKENIKVAKKSTKIVGSLFSKLKDKTPKELKSNVVYKLTCNTCDKVYVGQTSQWLKSRLALHKSDIRKGLDRCALAGHIKENPSHRISFDNAKILDEEKNYERRNFLEMVNINSFANTMNKRTDTQNLNVIYTYLLDCARNDLCGGPIDE